MLYPSINEIRKKADSRYTIVILAAKRARDIIDGKPILTDVDISKHVVSTGSGGNIVRFSSNYLYVTDIGGSYGTRKVTTMHDNVEKTDNFTVEVCNYIYGNTAAVNSNDINYSLVAELVYTGAAQPEGITIRPVSGEPVRFVNGSLTISDQRLPAGVATADKFVC